MAAKNALLVPGANLVPSSLKKLRREGDKKVEKSMHDFKWWLCLNSLLLAFYGLYCTSWPLFKRSHSSGKGMPEGELCHFLKGLLKATHWVDGKMNENFRTWLNGVICVTITLKTIFWGEKKLQKESSMIGFHHKIVFWSRTSFHE